MSIFDILGLLIVLSGILAISAVMFFDPMRAIISHRPIPENDIGPNGTATMIAGFMQILVGIGIIIAHMLLKNLKIHPIPK